MMGNGQGSVDNMKHINYVVKRKGEDFWYWCEAVVSAELNDVGVEVDVLYDQLDRDPKGSSNLLVDYYTKQRHVEGFCQKFVVKDMRTQ